MMENLVFTAKKRPNRSPFAEIWCTGHRPYHGGQCRAEKRIRLQKLWAVLPWGSEGPRQCGLFHEVAAIPCTDCN